MGEQPDKRGRNQNAENRKPQARPENRFDLTQIRVQSTREQNRNQRKSSDRLDERVVLKNQSSRTLRPRKDPDSEKNQKRRNPEATRSLVPARLDRLNWSRFHTRLVIALGVAWILDGLSVDADRMRANLDLTRGGILAEELMMRLGETLGHETAHELVGRAAKRAAVSGAALDEELEGDVQLAAPEDYVGWSADTSRETAARIRAYLAT